jgi:hypothetical protein
MRLALSGTGGWLAGPGSLVASTPVLRPVPSPSSAPTPGLSKALGLNQTHVTTHSMGTVTHMPPELFK